MYKILVSLLSIMGIIYFGENGVAGELEKRTGWFPHSMVKDSSLIIKGTVHEFDYSEIANLGIVPSPSFYRITVKEKIKGTLSVSEIYLIEPPMSDSIDHPPYFLLKNDYVLFLKPKDDLQGLIHKIGVEERPIFETVGNWKGAVSLAQGNSERANRTLQQQYGLDATNEESRMITAIKDFLSYFLEPEREKRKAILNSFMAKQDPLYKSFADSESEAER